MKNVKNVLLKHQLVREAVTLGKTTPGSKDLIFQSHVWTEALATQILIGVSGENLFNLFIDGSFYDKVQIFFI